MRMIHCGIDRVTARGERIAFLILLGTVLSGVWAPSHSWAQPLVDEQRTLQQAGPPIHLNRLELGEEDVISLHFSDPPPPEVTIEGCGTFTDWSTLQILNRDEQRIQIKDPKAATDRSRFYRAKLMTPIQEWETALERWERLGLEDYEGRFQWVCYCVPDYVEPVFLTVRQGKIAAVEYVNLPDEIPPEQWSRYRTVGELFDWLREAIEGEPASFEADTHPEFGYPVSAFVDFEAGIADEEKGFHFELAGASKVLLTNEPRDAIEKDAVSLGEVSVRDLELELEFSYSGGCQTHFFALYMSPDVFMESFPPQANLFVRHEGNDDPCDAIVTETKSFDLQRVAERYRELFRHGGPLRLNLHGVPSSQPGQIKEVLVEIPEAP